MQKKDTVVKQDMIVSSTEEIAIAMVEATMQKTILTKVGELTGKLMETMGNAFNVNPDKIANAFKFESFMFDAFEKLDDMAILRVKREEEFAPVKNAEGNDSPETARRLYKEFYGIKQLFNIKNGENNDR